MGASGILLENRYRILRQIGGGGMGMVYQAEDTRLPGRHCAIKEMSPAQVPPQDRNWAISAFQQEAQMLACLQHPGLTAVTDFFPEASNWYLVMDYVEGGTLEGRLQQSPSGRLPLQDVLDIASQLCDVLEYLHGQNPPVIFRDLKPGNVMLTPEGKVKLIDFGIARFFKPGKARDTQRLGTPGYAAPEQYAGAGQTDARSDLYSLGVLLHQLLTGHDPTRTPFNLPPMQSLNVSMPVEVEAVVNRAIQLPPDLRFQSAREFRQALLQFGAWSASATLPTAPLYQQPAPAMPPAVPFLQQPAAPMPRALPQRPPTALMPSARSGGHTKWVWFVLALLAVVIAIAVIGWLTDQRPASPTALPGPVVTVQTPTIAPTSTLIPTPAPTRAPTQTFAPTLTPSATPFTSRTDHFDTLSSDLWTVSSDKGIDVYADGSLVRASRQSTKTYDWTDAASLQFKYKLNLTGRGTTIEWSTTIEPDARWTLVYSMVSDDRADRYLNFDCSVRDSTSTFICSLSLRELSSGRYLWSYAYNTLYQQSGIEFRKGVFYSFKMVNPASRRVQFYVNDRLLVTRDFTNDEWNGMSQVDAMWVVKGWPANDPANSNQSANTIRASLDYFSCTNQ